jgi:thiol-disulfide isomerase/thioredoxin
MKKFHSGLPVFILGVAILIISSYTRTFSAEYIQFPVLLIFFSLSGWLLSQYYKKIWPYPLLFILPTVVVIISAFILNKRGFFHFMGETLMIIPGFIVGFYLSGLSKKIKFISAILLPVFYFFYISKINPQLNYYNNTVSIKGAKAGTKGIISELQFYTKDNTLVPLGGFKGKVVMIDFYFNRCSQCIKKMPELVKLKNHYRENSSFELLTIHSGRSESFGDFIAFLKNLPPELNYVYDSLSTASRYLGIEAYPVEILIDKQGKIRHQFAGYNRDVALVYEENTINKINVLLNENY